MDALTLAVTLNPVATPASSAGDNALLAAAPAGPHLDFATLLAAGMATPNEVAEAAASPEQGDMTVLFPEREAEQSEQSMPADDFGSPALAAAQLPIQLALPMHLVDARRVTDPLPHADDALMPGGVRKDVPSGAPVAAAAASLAGKAAASDQASARLAWGETAARAQPGVGTAPTEVAAAPTEVAAAPTEVATAPTETATAGIEAEAAAARSANAAESPSAAEATHTVALHSVEQRPIAQPTAVREVAAPLGSTGFADALSQQVVWMVDKDAQIAELHINPPELGPIEVRLTLSGDEASAQFVSPHAEVRSAIESAIARLRESMAQAGIQLGEASVSADSFRGDQTASQSEPRHARSGYAEPRDPNERVMHVLPAVTARRGLVDLFA